MLHTPPWWPERLGKRAVGMIGCAYIWGWLGLGNYQDAPIQRPDVLWLNLDPDVRALLWIVPAVVALLTCMSRRWSIVGLVLLALPSLLVVGSYGGAWILWLVTDGAQGFMTGYYSAAIFGSTFGMIAYVAAQPSPPIKIVRSEL